MNWQQYLLSKIAEESVEVAKEALKSQSFGLMSQYQNSPAYMHLANELVDLMAVVEMLSHHPHTKTQLNGVHFNPFHTTLPLVHTEMTKKMEKVCYYAMHVYREGNLHLTPGEYESIYAMAMAYGAKYNLDYIGNIAYRG